MKMSYWQYQGTAQTGIARIICSINGLHGILCAPGGDSYIYSLFTLLERMEHFPPLTTCVIDGRTLSRGLNRLPVTLQEVYQKHKPGLIVVANSCTSSLLSQDLETEIKAATFLPGISEVLLYTPNPYRVKENEAAETLLGFITRRFANTALPPTSQPSVNIIGPSSLGFHHRHDLISLKRMVTSLGLKINLVYPLEASLDEVKKLSQAWVTIASYRELGYDTARWLETTYGIPAVVSTPIGIYSTQQWISEILKAVSNFAGSHGLKFENPKIDEANFAVDNNRMTGRLSENSYPSFALKQIQGAKIIIFGDFTHATALAKMLSTEMDVRVVGAGTYELELKNEFERTVQPFTSNILVTDEFEQVNQWVAALKSHLLLGSHLERYVAARLNIPFVAISSPSQIQDFSLGYEPLLGFDGAGYILDCLYRASFKIETPSYNQNSSEPKLDLEPAQLNLSLLRGQPDESKMSGSRLGWGELVKPPRQTKQ